MQKELCTKLLNLLERHGIELGKRSISPKTLLNLSDKVVEKIIEIPSKFQLWNVLNYLEYCYSLGVKDEEFVLPAIDVIASCNSEFQIEYATKVLYNENAKNANISFVGAQIIASCDEEFQAKNGKDVLCDADAIEAGVALPGTIIIAGCNKEFQAKYCKHIFRHPCIGEHNREFALQFARIIASCPNEELVENCYSIYNETIDEETYLNGSYIYEIEEAKTIAGYGQYLVEEPQNINDLTVNGILALIEKESFDESNEINEETVSQFIKKK